jgi:hypothetical protein
LPALSPKRSASRRSGGRAAERRAELQHAIRAATEIVAADRVIVIGSQAILGSFDDDELPAEATLSIEVDIAPLHDDDASSLATLIDAFLGEWSQFHETHGFYVQGVGRETAVLPTGWEERLVAVQGPETNGRTGLCLDPHDLCVAKLAAAREKDFRFVGALLRAGLVELDTIAARAQMLPPSAARSRTSIEHWISANRTAGHPDPPARGIGL